MTFAEVSEHFALLRSHIAIEEARNGLNGKFASYLRHELARAEHKAWTLYQETLAHTIPIIKMTEATTLDGIRHTLTQYTEGCLTEEEFLTSLTALTHSYNGKEK